MAFVSALEVAEGWGAHSKQDFWGCLVLDESRYSGLGSCRGQPGPSVPAHCLCSLMAVASQDGRSRGLPGFQKEGVSTLARGCAEKGPFPPDRIAVSPQISGNSAPRGAKEKRGPNFIPKPGMQGVHCLVSVQPLTELGVFRYLSSLGGTGELCPRSCLCCSGLF